LQRKFLAGFVVLLGVATIGFYFYMSHLLNQHTRGAIAGEMKRLQMFAYEHIDHYTWLHDVRRENWPEHSEALVRSLSLSGNVPVAYYDAAGAFRTESQPMDGGIVILKSKPSEVLQRLSGEDLIAAADNQSFVSVLRGRSASSVVLTLPVYLPGERVGFLRISSDYSETFRNHDVVLRSLIGFSLILWVLLVVLTWTFVHRMTRPLSELSRAMLQFGEGRLGSFQVAAANDETAVLADSFGKMRSKLEEQMETVVAEKNKVVALERNRRDFFRNVTHELKTPLTTISGYAQILEAPDFDDSEFLRTAAGRIHRESRRLHRMMVDIIEHSRREFDPNVPRGEFVALEEALEEATEDMQLKAERRLMHIEYRPESLAVNGNALELRKVWDNLLDNAIKYGKPESAIEVSVQAEENEAIIRVVNEADPRHRFDKQMAFEPFYRSCSARSKEQGSVGLGLSICKQIVELHHGSITLEVQGSSVILEIRLPLRSQVGNNYA